MKLSKKFSQALIIASFTAVSFGSAIAAETTTYQVTGPVLAVTPTSITVQKDNEKWEIARDAKTPVKGDLKVGSKVTIKYRMTAANIDVKDK